MIYSSKIYIPIFSKLYARSPWCLDSLTLMVEHTSRSGGKEEILPVFYNVERSDVKLETSLYRRALDTHEKSFGNEKVERCKKALVVAGNVKGWERSSYESENELFTSIVGNILYKQMIELNCVFEGQRIGHNPKLSYRTSSS
ncbi:disease resistance protein RPS6-like [Eucalyptus grandis]|uniref:disease resistance protein RPS6-like n=1 Tax=Eucalyptus grandis TaxID=71139 RepID=UPI00192EB761|nr:disease resistance protein RPS6-like [Eucalyptus grandis]